MEERFDHSHQEYWQVLHWQMVWGSVEFQPEDGRKSFQVVDYYNADSNEDCVVGAQKIIVVLVYIDKVFIGKLK